MGCSASKISGTNDYNKGHIVACASEAVAVIIALNPIRLERKPAKPVADKQVTWRVGAGGLAHLYLDLLFELFNIDRCLYHSRAA